MSELTDTWPPRWKGANFKKPIIAKAVRAKKLTKLRTQERNEKDATRERDVYCRFPLCGCRKLKLPLESAHGKHKGMGGDPKGKLSKPENLITLCHARHRTLPISIHAGNLRVVALSPERLAGPCSFEIDLRALVDNDNFPSKAFPLASGWFEVGRELSRHCFEPFTVDQKRVLKALAAMTV